MLWLDDLCANLDRGLELTWIMRWVTITYKFTELCRGTGHACLRYCYILF